MVRLTRRRREQQQADKQVARKRKKAATAKLPARFEPRFWVNADQRQKGIREINRRYETLVADTNANSYQKELLVQRAVFVSIQVETMEREAMEGLAPFNAAAYTRLVNTLTKLLSKLGLKRSSQMPWLQAFPKNATVDAAAYESHESDDDDADTIDISFQDKSKHTTDSDDNEEVA